MRGPRAGWGALTAPPDRPAPQPASPGPPPARAQSPPQGLAFAFDSRGPSGEGTSRQRPATAAQGSLPADAAENQHGGRRPGLPPPPPRHGCPWPGGPKRTPSARAAHPEAARIPGPGPAAPAPSFRPRVRPSGGARPAPLSGGASRCLLPLAGPSLLARSGEVCTSSPRSGARAKSETQPPTEKPGGRPRGTSACRRRPALGGSRPRGAGAGARSTKLSARGWPRSCQKHEWEAVDERTPGL